jgi:hypothetical protein
MPGTTVTEIPGQRSQVHIDVFSSRDKCEHWPEPCCRVELRIVPFVLTLSSDREVQENRIVSFKTSLVNVYVYFLCLFTSYTHYPLSQYTSIYTKGSMTVAYNRSPTPSPQVSGVSSSKFKEHLSLTIPPPDPSHEHSRFSPDSPTFSLGGFAMHKYFTRSKPRDFEEGSATSLSAWSAILSFRHHFDRIFSHLRASRKEDGPSVQGVVPVATLPAKLQEWRPPDIWKQATQGQSALHDQGQPTRLQMLRARAPIAALIVFLLYLFINVIIINVCVFATACTPAYLPFATPPTSAPTTTGTLPANTQQCIAQYTLNAPSDPTGYPCSTCLPLLAALPMSATAVYPAALDATQFCGLRSIWEDAGQQGQAGLEAGGWVKDIKFCTWSGVRCDGTGRVSSLSVFMVIAFAIANHSPFTCRQLTFPAVPVSLPVEFTNLTALETLEIIGDGNTPGRFFATFW